MSAIPKRKTLRMGTIGTNSLIVGAVLLALILIVPMAYTLTTSLKPRAEIFEFPIRWIPKHVNLNNFLIPFAEKNFGMYFLNSCLVAVVVTICSMIMSSMAGYSLAKFDFRGRKVLFLAVLLTMMLPVEITIVPLALVTKSLGLMNTRGGLILPVIVSPLGIFWMRQFLITLPEDYANAGRIDGLGEFGIFFNIVLPMSTPALSALAIFSFMTNWNSLIWPLIVATKDAIRTIPVGLIAFVGEYDTVWNELFAMSVVAVLPTLFVFLILRARLIQGMAMVGLKG